MKQLSYEFSSLDAFKVVATLLNLSLDQLREIVADSDILQGRLIHSIVDEIYRSKVLIKLIKEPETYTITLKEQEVIAIKLLLTNYDFIEAPNEYTMAILSEFNSVIEDYLTNNPVKRKQLCVNLLSEDTSASSTLIEG